jgi:hypothetical protein
MTREAFLAMQKILKPEGTLVINAFGDFAPGKDFLAASLFDTLLSVFPSVRIHHERGEGGNTLFVASSRTNLAILHPPTFENLPSRCAAEVQDAFETLREPNPIHGIVLTDDFNPVEHRDARNREEMRRQLANSMREL